jgi:hypothetical protein
MINYREFYEERAAIREYEGGYSRKEAEMLAYKETQEKIKNDKAKENINNTLLLSPDKS